MAGVSSGFSTMTRDLPPSFCDCSSNCGHSNPEPPGKYEVEFLLRQVWVDSRMEHDDNDRHSYLSGMHHVHDIWLPDTFFIKHGDFKEPLTPDHIALKIYRDGTVDYTRRRHLILSCIGNLNIFPFDDPACTFAIESSEYTKLLLRSGFAFTDLIMGAKRSETDVNFFLAVSFLRLLTQT
ncbi:Neurotransmitter-gated ion-channel ligand-binding domain [Trinorchestia longiramus]|nr:Neurotransmitter-gated ion-channel ligand-binding domain [Trinorchestia longiramus]